MPRAPVDSGRIIVRRPPRARGRAPIPAAACTTLLALAIVCAASAHADEAPDTLGIHYEVGASTEVSTEQFFEDAFVDSVALGLRSVSRPETRYAAVGRASLTGTRGGRTSAFRVDNELSWGDLVRRDELSADWRRTGRAPWTWALAPRAEYAQDRTFGRDLEQTRAAASGRIRREWIAIESAAELSARGDVLRTHGRGADFLPDRNAGALTLRLERTPLMGSEWQLGYGATARAFPDSVVRNHIEQRAEAGWRRYGTGGHRFETSLELVRRNTTRPAPTSQDRYREAEASAVAELAFGETWGGSFAANAERLRYDARDSTVFFDYDLARIELAPRWSAAGWTIKLGPRAEWLRSPEDASETYSEVSGVLDVEWAGRGWWSVVPSAGWRAYRSESAATPASGALAVSASRSSFAFVQLDALIDQPLPGAIRARLFGSTRLEQHTDSAQNARSLYISLDVRRLF